MTAEDFRRLALSLAGATEGAHMGHPDFRANGGVFASLHAGDRTGMVKVTPEEQARLVQDAPKVFAPAAGAWGRQGYTVVTLAPAREPAVRGAMLQAFELAMAKSSRNSRRPHRAALPRRPRR